MGVVSPPSSGPSTVFGAAPQAARLQVPGWRNPRLIAGLLLVFASIAIGARVMAAADHTVPVYAARAALPTGSVLSAGDLSIVRLRLTGTEAQYLDAREAVPAGRVLLRPVGAGEVIPQAAVVPAAQLRLRPVPISLDGPVPRDLVPGARVDIWASAKAPASEGNSYLDAQRIADAAEVFSVDADAGGLSAGAGSAVQVLVPDQELTAVLNALANESRLVVLPIPGSGSPLTGEQAGAGP